MATTDSSSPNLGARLEQMHLKSRQDVLIAFVQELGTEHSLQAILDEIIDNDDKEFVLGLKPIDLVRSSAGPNGHATAPTPMVPPVPAPPRSAAKPTASKPKAAKAAKADAKKAEKAAAKKPAKAAKKAAKKPAKVAKPAKAAKKPAKKPAKPLTAKKAAKKAAKPPAAPPAASSPAASSPASPSSAKSLKAQVAEAVSAYVATLAKGTRFKTSAVLAALGTGNDDVSKRTKVVAALKSFEEAKRITHEGDGRAAEWVVL